MHGFVSLFYVLIYMQYHSVIVISSSGREDFQRQKKY